MYASLFVVFTPLVGSILTGLRSKYSYCKYDHPLFISTLLLFFSFVTSIFLAFTRLSNNLNSVWYRGVWFLSDSYFIDWSYRYDGITSSMFIIVTGISFFVHLYSIYYMRGDPNISRFFSFLSLFTFFMLLLASSNNVVQLFIGWEGVGLCSFLLISFWTERVAANKAAIKAMIVNKIGDCFFVFGSAQLLQLFGTLDLTFLNFDFFNYYNFYTFFSSSYFLTFEFSSIFPALLFMLFGAMAKSAQFGFHTWLPDAMEGPTPVSALIHAATMVTAGVVLLLRLSSLFSLSDDVQFLVVIVGLLTMLFAATTALFQNDIKKVIAYSTCSQLGYMVAACGYSFYGVAFFHLLTHAFFKALLFLCAGSLIHFFSDEQDSRKMGGVSRLSPVTYISFFVATLSLLAFPYTSGFYSKDWLLELFFIESTSFSRFGYFIGLLTAFLTSFYSFKVFFIAIFGGPLSSKRSYLTYHHEESILFYVFFPLVVFSMSFGYFYKDLFFSSLFFSFENSSVFLVTVPFFIKILPLIVTVLGVSLSYIYCFHSSFFIFTNLIFREVYLFFSNKWYFDYFYNVLLTNSVFFYSRYYAYTGVEKGWIEILGPSGVVSSVSYLSVLINRFQNGDFFAYLFFLFFGLTVFIL